MQMTNKHLLRKQLTLIFGAVLVGWLLVSGAAAPVDRKARKETERNQTKVNDKSSRLADYFNTSPLLSFSSNLETSTPFASLLPAITVNSKLQSPGESGDCTLGEAIQAANTDTAVDELIICG